MIRSLTSVRVQKLFDNREEGASVRERKSGVRGSREHVSVMAKEVVAMLDPKEGEVVIDGTAGQGGHSEAILKHASVTLLAIDADDDAVAHTQLRLQKLGKRAHGAAVVRGNFGDIKAIAYAQHLKFADKILLDLGWNMGQLESGRGFSFLHDEPLDMSYGEAPASGFTAAEVLNTWSEKAIADALFGYGEERYARRIARAVVSRREMKPIETTLEFAEIINDAVPSFYRHGRIHPATKSFQALRIAVNDELGVLRKFLHDSLPLLSGGGRMAIITFHSIEDRLVKQTFAAWAKEKKAKLLTKKPITAADAELTANRPSRSAKLRGIEKI